MNGRDAVHLAQCKKFLGAVSLPEEGNSAGKERFGVCSAMQDASMYRLQCILKSQEKLIASLPEADGL